MGHDGDVSTGRAEGLLLCWPVRYGGVVRWRALHVMCLVLFGTRPRRPHRRRTGANRVFWQVDNNNAVCILDRLPKAHAIAYPTMPSSPAIVPCDVSSLRTGNSWCLSFRLSYGRIAIELECCVGKPMAALLHGKRWISVDVSALVRYLGTRLCYGR